MNSSDLILLLGSLWGVGLMVASVWMVRQVKEADRRVDDSERRLAERSRSLPAE